LLILVIVINMLDLGGFLRWRATSFQTYDSVRFARQAAGVEAGLTHVFGIGPGQLFHAHSLYARTLGEYGIPGFISLLACFFIVFASVSLRAMQETSKPYGLSPRVMCACFAGLLMNSLVIDTIHWRHFWVVFALSWTVASAGVDPAWSESQVGSRAKEACS
jgi:hypothetical protein